MQPKNQKIKAQSGNIAEAKMFIKAHLRSLEGFPQVDKDGNLQWILSLIFEKAKEYQSLTLTRKHLSLGTKTAQELRRNFPLALQFQKCNLVTAFHKTFKISLWSTLAILLSLASCTLRPQSIPEVIPKDQIKISESANQKNSKDFRDSLLLIIPDPIVRAQFCEEFQETAFFQRVQCEEKIPLTNSPSFTHTLLIKTKISEISRNIWNNFGTSALYLTTLLKVSNTAKVDYDYQYFYQEQLSSQEQFQSTGEVGMWSMLPTWTGFIGTGLGTFSNVAEVPYQLRDSCLEWINPLLLTKESEGKNESEYQGKSTQEKLRVKGTIKKMRDCQFYWNFHQEALSQVWLSIWEKIQQDVSLKTQFPVVTTSTFSTPSTPSTPPFSEVRRMINRKVPTRYDVIINVGQIVRDDFKDIVLRQKTDYLDSRMLLAGISYPHPTSIRRLTFETEGQIAKHHGIQNHMETNLMLVARIRFLEDSYPVSFAFAEGISYAWEIPIVEKEEQDKDTSQFLNYFYVEADVGFPKLPSFPRFLFRIHHRSGVFGAYCPEVCGSNVIVYGVKFASNW